MVDSTDGKYQQYMFPKKNRRRTLPLEAPEENTPELSRSIEF